MLPRLREVSSKTRGMLAAFRGLNWGMDVEPDEFTDMENMSSAAYPALGPRARRAKLMTFTKPNGMCAVNGSLFWVDGMGLYQDGAQVGTVSDRPKQLVPMGARVIVWPDKYAYNTVTREMEYLDITFITSPGAAVTYEICKADGTAYSSYITSATQPTNPTNGKVWIDTSVTPNVMRVYSSTTEVWSAVPTTYFSIASPGIDTFFKQGDGVTITGAEADAANGDFVLQVVEDGRIVVIGMMPYRVVSDVAIEVARKLPAMDFIVEHENRLWGCSSEKHEVYASKLGDLANFNVFQGVATDSYAATVGAGGAFTGVVSHLGYVLFFQQEQILKVYGSKPSNFQITPSAVRGTQAGSHRSLAVVDEALLYKAAGGVCLYSMAIPTVVSGKLGDRFFTGAVAAATEDRYYVSMRDSGGVWHLFVYDARRGLWHREDGTHALYFVRLEQELFYVDAADKGLYSVGGGTLSFLTGTPVPEGLVSWRAETGDQGMELPGRKTLSRMMIRVEVDEGALIKILMQYDRSGIWEEVYRVNSERKRMLTIPITPRRCDSFRIRFEGEGRSLIHAISKTTEEGSEIR